MVMRERRRVGKVRRGIDGGMRRLYYNSYVVSVVVAVNAVHAVRALRGGALVAWVLCGRCVGVA